HLFSGGWQPITCAGIGTAGDPIDHNQVAFSDQLPRYDGDVGKCLMPSFQRLLVFLQSDIAMDAVIDEIFGIKLLGKFELSAAEEFLERAFCEGLVLLLQ